MKVAVVGAGVTGCLLSHFLNSANIKVSIFEKSRGIGGRASTKRTDWGQCDLGATIVPAQKANFIGFMQGMRSLNIVSRWPNKVFMSQQSASCLNLLSHFESDRQYYVFNSKMDAACRHWIKNASLNTSSLINQIRYLNNKGWQLKINGVWQTEYFDKVIVTAPWPQSKALLTHSELSLKLPDFSQFWTSCWSVALKVEPLVSSDVDLVYLKKQFIQTLVRDSGKPLRPQVFTLDTGKKSEIWVAQLANKLSDELGKSGKIKAIAIASKGLCELFNLPDKSVKNTFAHYWQYARPTSGQKPLGILSQPDNGLYVGGDWSFGASIESAYEAAITLSQSIIGGSRVR